MINVPSNVMLLNYQFREQILDIMPNLVMALVAGGGAYFVLVLELDYMLTLCIQGIVSTALYLGLSRMSRSENLQYIRGLFVK